MSLDYLPKTYDPQNQQTVTVYNMFFDTFGTSVVTEADMGGLVWAETWYQNCLERIFSDICINHEVHRGYWIFHKDTQERACDTRLTQDFNKTSEWHFELQGGTSKVDQAHWRDWAKTVKYDPRPVKMNVAPIHYLLPDGHPNKEALIAATNAYLQHHEEQKKADVEAMEAVRPAPPSLCNKYKQEVLPLRDDPRQALCPIVGYHGAFCPSPTVNDDTSYDKDLKLLQAGQQLLLPKGVGMTIDVSTGELKLPAWNYDFNGATSYFTDPLSGETFLLPKGLSLSIQVSGENVPQTHVFKTAAEVASVWETGYKDGNWLGGEFGHSKSILDLYNKFFSKQQSSAINQHPQALYRLTLDPNWEFNLNPYAMYSLKSLPQTYNENIYSRFMETWGTHIAMDTLVGGMTEQQVIMKDCILQSPDRTGGLSPEQLRQYLKMDLEKTPPMDSYYTERRQMSIDHKIGGNPELTDQEGWKRSIAKDPALIKIYSHVDWAFAAENTQAISSSVVANLRRAIKDRMDKREQARRQEEQAAITKEIEDLQGPRAVTAILAHGRSGSNAPYMEQGKSLTMAGYSQCPAGLAVESSSKVCNTGVDIVSMNSQNTHTPLRYERNHKGEFRAIGCVDFDGCGNCGEHAGSFIKNGCSMMPGPDGSLLNLNNPIPYNTAVGVVCSDCQIMQGSFPKDGKIQCICPGY